MIVAPFAEKRAALVRSSIVRHLFLSLASFIATTSTTARAEAPPPAGACKDSTTWLALDALPDGTPPAAQALDTWLAPSPDRPDPDVELLDPDAIAVLNERNVETIGAWRDPLLDRAPGSDEIDAELVDRMTQIRGKLRSGDLILGPEPGSSIAPDPNAFATAETRLASSLPVDVVQAVVDPIDLRCIPLDGGLYRGHVDRWFDRNQCSRLHPGDMVRVLRRTTDHWLYVRAGHGVGWLEDALLSPPMTPGQARSLRARPRLSVLGDMVPATTAHGDLTFLRMGTGFPLVDDRAADYQILIPTSAGWTDAFVAKSPAVHEGFLPFTRRNVLSLAFARMGDPYGWGGYGGFRDCSGLLLDVSAEFDLRLGRNSSVQALAGARVVDVAGMPEADKLAAIRAAAAHGIVFLYMPGHIMLFLGDLDGRPYALSAISEYLLPCPEGGYRTVRLDRVEVTDLERGRDTERTAFIERIATLAVFGQ